MEKLRNTSVLRFGTYEVDPHAGELRKSGVRIKVQQQPLKLLEILLENPGEVVTREDLRSRIWPEESFGDFDQAVNVAIAKLRGALGDSADNPRYIETIPRRGYRFIAEVSVLRRDSGKTQIAKPIPTAEGSSDSGTAISSPVVVQPSSSRRFWTIVSVVSVFLLAFLVFAIVRWRERASANVSSANAIRSLAVLPLENLSGDAEDYFADGMTDELITDLAQIGALRVISRTSVMPYKGVRRPLPAIARELNVDAIVEGTVTRSGDQVRITAQLIQAANDRHLWAESYQGDVRNTLSLQKQVASAVADQIRIELTPNEQAVLKTAKTVDPEAYEYYLKGRFFFSKRNSNEKARAYFQQAIEKDPNYAPPYTGLADIDQLADNPSLSRQALQKALDLDSTLPEAHNSLAQLLFRFDRDWAGAEKEFKRALELNPSYAPAHHWYSMYLSFTGRKSQALAEAEKAEELDPLSPVVGANLAKILDENSEYEKALDRAKRTLELDPNSAVTHAVLGLMYDDKKMYPQAISEYKISLQLGGETSEMNGYLGYVYAVTGDRGNADKTIRELKQLWPQRPRAALDLAIIYSGLGRKDDAMYWLGKAEEKDVGDLVGIGQSPRFAVLRNDQRFRVLVKQVGAPQ
ncbi:MAG TPA: winged helix-turn-helix domain-containing protein [Terriglobales bacterium]|jgi:TolB-like protein/DNA-binding winged helix-turn-helix (wHTH) protein/Flp pilus assembly protein TadD|nr:winged helix-turn-helix domain-containing protein [Terriglobales bacterium]